MVTAPGPSGGVCVPLSDGPVTLLVVDDEEAIRNALRKFLVQQGYEVATAATGEEALTASCSGRRSPVCCWT